MEALCRKIRETVKLTKYAEHEMSNIHDVEAWK